MGYSDRQPKMNVGQEGPMAPFLLPTYFPNFGPLAHPTPIFEPALRFDLIFTPVKSRLNFAQL